MNDKQSLRLFRSLLSQIKYSNSESVDDKVLWQFLRVNDQNVPRALNRLLLYEETKKLNPDLFVFSTELKTVFESHNISISNERTTKGELVLITYPGRWNPSGYSFRSLMQATCVALQAEMDNEETQKNGIVNIVDCSGFGMGHLFRFGPLEAKLFADLIEKILPMKYNSINLVNESKFAKFAFRLMKSFLNAEMREKLHFHGKQYEQLLSFVDPSALPAEFGGECDTLTRLEYYERIQKHYTRV